MMWMHTNEPAEEPVPPDDPTEGEKDDEELEGEETETPAATIV